MNREHQPKSEEDLLIALESSAQSKDSRGRAIKKTFSVLDSDKQVVSWKFKEWDYGKEKVKLPSFARGLFTLENSSKIVARGYDKFFNINEVYFTKWSWLEENTNGPFYITAKENGCILLISGLSDGTIVVCSKHSTGPRTDVDRNHALAGQKFLTNQLSKLGLTTKEFALKLSELNVTAVAEFCDDSFEEHIVEYTGDNAGLYLHGLNLNKPIFETHPINKVNKFAATYGFKSVDYFVIDTIEKLKEQLTLFSKSGTYNGKETEGFVIRSKLQNGEDYFFKFKFEEPYLMYRQWREVTKDYISNRKRTDIKISKHKFITNNYLDFVIPLIEDDTKLAESFLKGFGIITLRKNFLEHYGKSGAEILNQELLEELDAANALDNLKIDDNTKFVFVPIATIGCGKTTTILTITQLFEESFDLIINDNLPSSKNTKVEFVKKSLQVLQKKRAVFMDRNNHQYRERQQIFDDFKKLRDGYLSFNTNVQFVALNFIKEGDAKVDNLWDITTKRVFDRGDNHQSIKASSDSEKVVKSIMSGFVERFQPLRGDRKPDSNFDLIINLEVSSTNSSLLNAKKILSSLHDKYPLLVEEVPCDEILNKSFEKALEYKPTFTKTFGKKNAKSKVKIQSIHPDKDLGKKVVKKRPVYFSIKITDPTDLIEKIKKVISTKHETSFLDQLITKERVQAEFHVTLAHVNQGKRGNEEERKIWQEYLSLYESKIHENKEVDLGIFASIRLKSVIWDEKALLILVEVIKYTEADVDLKLINKFPHITIGTSSIETSPVYSNTLAQNASLHSFKDGRYPELTVVNWDSDELLENLPVIVNY